MTRARQRVADTALKLFAQRGYDGVSMRDLAGELRIQAPSIYSHFASKADLLRSLILPAVEGLNQLIDRAPTEADDIARQQWLEAYVRWLIDNREACRVGLLDPGVRADPIVGPAVLDTRRRLFDLMRQFGAVDDAAARAAKGSLIYPVLIEGVNEPEIPRLAAAAIRALGAEMADRDL